MQLVITEELIKPKVYCTLLHNNGSTSLIFQLF